MGENADFTAREAARAIAETATYEGALRQRTEGLTNMVWGLVSPAIFVSYGLVGSSLRGPPSPEVVAVFATLWAPWVAAGIVLTVSLWRSAALAAPGLAKDQPTGWAITLAWLAAYVTVGGLAVVVVRHMNEPTYALLGLGAAWTIFGAANLYRLSDRGRRAVVAVGVVLFAAGIALAVLLPEDRIAGYMIATVVGAVVSGVAPIAAGLWQASRA